MNIQAVENMCAAELKAQTDGLVDELAKGAPLDLAVYYISALTDAKVRDEKLAEQAETLTALKKGIESITQQAVDADRAGDKLIEELTAREQKAQGVIAALEGDFASAKASYTILLDEASADAAIELGKAEGELVAAREDVVRLADAIVRHVNTIHKLTIQANTYAEVIGRANAMFLEAMTAKAVADTAADAS